MDDDVVKNNPAENADAVEPGATTGENQGTQAEQPDDEFMSALGGDNGSLEKGEQNPETETTQPKNSAEMTGEKAQEGDDKQNSDDGQNAKGAERRKEQLNSEIRELVAQRNAIREETSRLIKEQYGTQPGSQAKTEDELVNTINPETGDYYTRAEAQAEITKNRLDQLEQERQREVFANQIAESRFAMEQEAAKVVKDFPMFDSQSDQFNKEISTEAAEILSGAIETDPQTGMQIGCKIPIYRFYSMLAKATESARKQGEIAGREAAQKMMGAVDTVGNNGNAKGSSEELDDFERSLLED